MKKLIVLLLVILSLVTCAAAEDITAMGQQAAETVKTEIPILFLTGDTVLMTKHNSVALQADYFDGEQEFHGYASVKWQGTSSIAYDKKNYTIELYADEALTALSPVDVGWGAQSEYCLKANYIDHSHARNVVSARLWGDVVRSRAGFSELPEEMRTAPNVGAVDGFAIKLYLNGEYEGLYTWNIPKAAWMFGMDETNEDHTILLAEDYNSGCFLTAAYINGSDWTDEVHDTVPESILTRWNEVIDFVLTSSDEEFVAGIDTYIDKESLIDYYLFAYLSCGLDSMGKNQVYATYDGTKWYASMYDMDSTWGLYFSGTALVNPDHRCQEDYESCAGGKPGNLLYQRVAKLFPEEIKTRYAQLRAGALSDVNIMRRFEEFNASIPANLFAEDLVAYPDIPLAEENNLKQILSFFKARAAYVDGMIAATGKQDAAVAETPTEPYTLNGKDVLGNFAFRLNGPMKRSSFSLDTGFKPFDTEKDWTIYCKFADSMVAEDGQTAVIFEMRETFPEDNTQSAVYLRRTNAPEGMRYEMGGGFGGFSFPFDHAPDYVAPDDGYHKVVISKKGDQYSFYLDGFLAYNSPLGYGVTPDHYSDSTLYLFGRMEDGLILNRAFGEIADFRIYECAISYDQLMAAEQFLTNGTDAHGAYLLKTKAPLVSEGELINTGFMPYATEKDWSIICKFSEDMTPVTASDMGSVFEMRQRFSEQNIQTAVFLRKYVDTNTYGVAGGFGGFTFPVDNAPGYEASTDGYHYAAIVKEGGYFYFYLDGGLAYSNPLDYTVTDEFYSTEQLYLFGRMEGGYPYNVMRGEIADFRIYDGAFSTGDINAVLAEMKK